MLELYNDKILISTATPELIPSPVPEPPAVAPRFTLLLTDNHVTEGNPITLRAAVTGQPKPSVSWFRDGAPLITDSELQVKMFCVK